MDIAKLLDRCREATGATSDNQLAKRLGVGRSTVSNYRSGRALPDAVVCATIAGLTGEPLAKILGIVGEARAISREEKAVWRKLAATAALLLCVALPWANPAIAYPSEGHSSQPELCIMRSVRRAGRWIARLAFGLIRGRQPPALLA